MTEVYWLGGHAVGQAWAVKSDGTQMAKTISIFNVILQQA